jgi:hypothetical protein|tara:strand:+ start:528 stop:689 length:162 start_codon:yes stop_codon:yes gene_type:complete
MISSLEFYDIFREESYTDVLLLIPSMKQSAFDILTTGGDVKTPGGIDGESEQG